MIAQNGLPEPLTEQAQTVADVWAVFLPLCIAVLVLVVLLVLYVVIRFRRRSDELPAQNHYNYPAEIAYTAIPFLVVAGLFALTVTSLNTLNESHDEPDLVVDVLAFQWQWQFDYPESNVEVIGNDVEKATLVLPTDRAVRFNLTSADVIHSFWVPGFLFKRDVLPDRSTSFVVDVAGDPGEYNNGACAEYCGLFHDRMDFNLVIMTPDDFDAWLLEQSGERQ